MKPRHSRHQPGSDASEATLKRASKSESEAPVHAVEIVTIARALGRMKVLLLAFFLVAGLAGAITAYNVSLFPPDLEKRQFGYGTASLQILLDSETSPLRDVEADLTPLTARAQLFATFMLSQNVREQLARRMGVPVRDVALTSAPAENPRELVAPDSAGGRANALVYEGARYRLQIVAATNLPIISVTVLAPDGPLAVRLARIARQTLTSVIRTEVARGGTTSENPIRATPVGTPVNGDVSIGASVPVAVGVAVLTFIALILIALLLGNVFRSLYAGREVVGGG